MILKKPAKLNGAETQAPVKDELELVSAANGTVSVKILGAKIALAKDELELIEVSAPDIVVSEESPAKEAACNIAILRVAAQVEELAPDIVVSEESPAMNKLEAVAPNIVISEENKLVASLLDDKSVGAVIVSVKKDNIAHECDINTKELDSVVIVPAKDCNIIRKIISAKTVKLGDYILEIDDIMKILLNGKMLKIIKNNYLFACSYLSVRIFAYSCLSERILINLLVLNNIIILNTYIKLCIKCIMDHMVYTLVQILCGICIDSLGDNTLNNGNNSSISNESLFIHHSFKINGMDAYISNKLLNYISNKFLNYIVNTLIVSSINISSMMNNIDIILNKVSNTTKSNDKTVSDNIFYVLQRIILLNGIYNNQETNYMTPNLIAKECKRDDIKQLSTIEGLDLSFKQSDKHKIEKLEYLKKCESNKRLIKYSQSLIKLNGIQSLNNVIESGDVIITNDGATILSKTEVQHAAAKILIKLSKSQNIETSNGTTSICIIAGSLLEVAEDLLEKCVHPVALSVALSDAWKLRDMSYLVLLLNRDQLIKSAVTSLSSKVASPYSIILAPLAVDSALHIIDENKCILKIIKKILKYKSILRDAINIPGLNYLAKKGIMVIKDIEDEMSFIARSLGCKPVVCFDHLIDKLGSALLAEEISTSVVANPGETSVLIRGSNNLVLEEAERLLHDALCVVRINLIFGCAAAEFETQLFVQSTKYTQPLINVFNSVKFKHSLTEILNILKLLFKRCDNDASINGNENDSKLSDMVDNEIENIENIEMKICEECIRLCIDSEIARGFSQLCGFVFGIVSDIIEEFETTYNKLDSELVKGNDMSNINDINNVELHKQYALRCGMDVFKITFNNNTFTIFENAIFVGNKYEMSDRIVSMMDCLCFPIQIKMNKLNLDKLLVWESDNKLGIVFRETSGDNKLDEMFQRKGNNIIIDELNDIRNEELINMLRSSDKNCSICINKSLEISEYLKYNLLTCLIYDSKFEEYFRQFSDRSQSFINTFKWIYLNGINKIVSIPMRSFLTKSKRLIESTIHQIQQQDVNHCIFESKAIINEPQLTKLVDDCVEDDSLVVEASDGKLVHQSGPSINALSEILHENQPQTQTKFEESGGKRELIIEIETKSILDQVDQLPDVSNQLEKYLSGGDYKSINSLVYNGYLVEDNNNGQQIFEKVFELIIDETVQNPYEADVLLIQYIIDKRYIQPMDVINIYYLLGYDINDIELATKCLLLYLNSKEKRDEYYEVKTKLFEISKIKKGERLNISSEWSEQRINEGINDKPLHNALSKIYISINKNNAKQFLETNIFYYNEIIGKYCESLDPKLSFIPYSKALNNKCDKLLISMFNTALSNTQIEIVIFHLLTQLFDFQFSDNKRRQANTKLNTYSSRSRALLILDLYSNNRLHPQLCIVDLADSGGVKRTGFKPNGQRYIESFHINTSLKLVCCSALYNNVEFVDGAVSLTAINVFNYINDSGYKLTCDKTDYDPSSEVLYETYHNLHLGSLILILQGELIQTFSNNKRILIRVIDNIFLWCYFVQSPLLQGIALDIIKSLLSIFCQITGGTIQKASDKESECVVLLVSDLSIIDRSLENKIFSKLGNIAVENMNKYVTAITALMQMFKSYSDRRYLLLNSLQELITYYSSNNKLCELLHTNNNEENEENKPGDWTEEILVSQSNLVLKFILTINNGNELDFDILCIHGTDEKHNCIHGTDEKHNCIHGTDNITWLYELNGPYESINNDPSNERICSIVCVQSSNNNSKYNPLLLLVGSVFLVVIEILMQCIITLFMPQPCFDSNSGTLSSYYIFERIIEWKPCPYNVQKCIGGDVECANEYELKKYRNMCLSGGYNTDYVSEIAYTINEIFGIKLGKYNCGEYNINMYKSNQEKLNTKIANELFTDNECDMAFEEIIPNAYSDTTTFENENSLNKVSRRLNYFDIVWTGIIVTAAIGLVNVEKLYINKLNNMNINLENDFNLLTNKQLYINITENLNLCYRLIWEI